MSVIEKQLANYFNLEKENKRSKLASDMILTYLTYLYHGTIDTYNGYIETNFHNFEQLFKISCVVHDHKQKYT